VARAFLVALVASATELTKRKKRGFGGEFILPRFALRPAPAPPIGKQKVEGMKQLSRTGIGAALASAKADLLQ